MFTLRMGRLRNNQHMIKATSFPTYIFVVVEQPQVELISLNGQLTPILVLNVLMWSESMVWEWQKNSSSDLCYNWLHKEMNKYNAYINAVSKRSWRTYVIAFRNLNTFWIWAFVLQSILAFSIHLCCTISYRIKLLYETFLQVFFWQWCNSTFCVVLQHFTGGWVY